MEGLAALILLVAVLGLIGSLIDLILDTVPDDNHWDY